MAKFEATVGGRPQPTRTPQPIPKSDGEIDGKDGVTHEESGATCFRAILITDNDSN